MKIDRFYTRHGVSGFPLEKQIAMRDEAGYKDLPTYEDKAKSVAERSRMLRPTSRDEPETIGIAGIRCLATDALDIGTALAECATRQSALYTLDTMKLYEPGKMNPVGVAAMIEEYRVASKKQQTSPGRELAHKARTKAAEKKRAPIIKAAKPLWEKPMDEISTPEISRQVGAPVSTLNKWLGPRHKAIEAAKRRKPL